MKWLKPEYVLLTVVASKCGDLLARLERAVAENGYADEFWICRRDAPIGTRAAMLSQGDGVRGICAFGICINDNNVASVFDGRAVTEKMFRFHRFADPIHRVLVNDAETRAIIGKQAGQRASGCKLDPRDYDRLFAAVKGK